MFTAFQVRLHFCEREELRTFSVITGTPVKGVSGRGAERSSARLVHRRAGPPRRAGPLADPRPLDAGVRLPRHGPGVHEDSCGWTLDSGSGRKGSVKL